MILDTTLRDGEQAPMVSFTKKEKLLIAQNLDALGVDIIEAGIPAMGGAEKDCMEALLALNTRAKILAWNRMSAADIDHSAACGAQYVHIAAPTSDLHIQKKLGKSREWVIKTIRETVSYAVCKGMTVSVGAEDASRTEERFLRRFYKAALREGASRIRYADTVGLQDPFEAYRVIRKLAKATGVPIDYHGHNDFGMSTANAFSAWRAGAKVISCSINGLGERAGNTPLEEFVMAVKHIAKKEVGIRTALLKETSALVEACSLRKVHESKAIVGSRVYDHESGIHVHGLLKDPWTYQAFPPEDAGGKGRFVLGKFSGRSALAFFCAKSGLSASGEVKDAFLQHLRESCREKKVELPERMMEEYFRGAQGQS
jgi:homocitrate synthase NifV